MRFFDPAGARFGMPTYPFRLAPDGLATRRQLHARGLTPGRQPIAAQVLWNRVHGRREIGVAYLYRVELAAPRRPASPAVARALAAARRALSTCQGPCGRVFDFYMPTSTGRWCPECAEAAEDAWSTARVPSSPAETRPAELFRDDAWWDEVAS